MKVIHLYITKTSQINDFSNLKECNDNRTSSFKLSIRFKLWNADTFASITLIHLSIKSGAVFTKTDNVLLSSKH